MTQPSETQVRESTPPLSDRFILTLLALISATGPVALNIYLPALPSVQQEFTASVPDVQWSLSLALIAYASGLLLCGPLSDRFGRRPVLLGGIVVFLVGVVMCLFAASLQWLVAGRCVQAIGTAAGLIVSRAIVADLYPREKMAGMIASLTMVMVIGPTVAPSIGGWLVVQFGWRSLFVFLLGVGVAILWATWRYLPETRGEQTHPAGPRDQWRAARELLRRPLFAGFTLQGAVIYAVFLVFISIAPYVMVTGLGRPPTEYGTYYLLVAFGYFMGNWVVTRFGMRLGSLSLMNQGVAIATVSTLIALALHQLGLVHPAWIFVPMGILAFGQGMALPNVNASAVSLAPQNAGLASSIVGFTQQIVGAVCVQWIGTYPVDTPLPMLIFCAVASIFALVVLRTFMQRR